MQSSHDAGRSDPRVSLIEELNSAMDDLEDALAAIRGEQADGRLTPVQAATERAELLERHLQRVRDIRASHGSAS